MADVAPCSGYVLPLLLTIAIEGSLAFVLGIRTAADQGKLALTNVLTNLCLNALIVTFVGQMPEPGYILVMIVLEAVIVLTEARMLEALGVSFEHVHVRVMPAPLMCALALNIGSYGTGLLISWLIMA